MELLELFKKYLFSQKRIPSKTTVKNYTADVRHFILWFEEKYCVIFQETTINFQHWKQFKQAKENVLSESSLNRHLSSLRKFFIFLLITKEIEINPFDTNNIEVDKEEKDPWKMIAFKELLKKEKASKFTIKNYGIDIQQFLLWIESNKNHEIIDSQDILPLLNPYFIEQYKNALAVQQHFSESSIKRKTSSIKKYISWIHQEYGEKISSMNATKEILEYPQEKEFSSEKILDNENQENIIMNEISQESTIETIHINQAIDNTNQIAQIEKDMTDSSFAIPQSNSLEENKKNSYKFLDNNYVHGYYRNNSQKKRDIKNVYSKIPPVRLFQKLFRLINFIIDIGFVVPLKKCFQEADYLLWITKGKPIFSKKSLTLRKIENHSIEKIKDVYANSKYKLLSAKKGPRKSFFRLLIPDHVMTHLRHRPIWYHKYHSNPLAHYFHFAILVIFMSIIGINFYTGFFSNEKARPVFASLPTAPPKLLSFNGRLTDKKNEPITSRTNVRFAVYNSSVASGSALLWQEVNNVSPDKNGNVSVVLGSKSFLDQSIFSKNTSAWMGVTVEQADELRPRQQLATTGYAANTETVQGMLPITADDSGTKNVILALDSGGNLTINDSNNHTFQTTNGQFTLSGNTLVLGTNPASSSDVQIAPDGLGKLDIQKPIHNTSNYNNIPSALGSVEVDDTFSILASASGQSAFTINQNGYGPLISASSSGIAKFTVDNDGSITSAGDFSIKGNIKSNITPFGDTLTLGSNQSQWNKLFVKNIYLDGNPLTQVWQENKDSILPINQAKNLLIGLTASTSANFQVIASSGAIFTKSNITLIGNTATIGTVNNQTLQIGNPTTGAIALSPNNQTGIFVNKNGSVGIGTQLLPDATALHIQKNSTGSALVVADQLGSGNIFTAAQNGITKFFISNNGDTRITGAGLCVSSNNNCMTQNLTAGNLYATNVTVQPADLAENYISAEQLEPGDIIMPANDGNNAAITKSTNQYQSQVIGVVSTKPGFVLNSDAQTDSIHLYKYPIALSGRVPVKVSIANGVVRTGDLLTSSATPGVAMKATKAGPIIGKALEDFSSQTTGTVMTYISISFGNPSVSLADDGNLNTADQLLSSLNIDQKNLVLNFINKIANEAQIVFRNISLNIINAKQIAVDSIAVNKRLLSPIAEIDILHSNVISPLSNSGKISLQLTDNKISITADKNGTSSAVAIIDNQGNASFSGQLASNNLQVNQDATISGVLHARKIIADEIEGATTSGQYITNITNIYAATPTASLDADSNEKNAASPSSSLDKNFHLYANNFVDIASYSAELAHVGSLHVDTAKIGQGLVSLGPTSLADTSITGQLSIGSKFVFADNTINVLGGDLELQPLKQGGIAFAGHQVYIDTNGNITANGNARFNGVLAAHAIAPLPNDDLTIKLDNGNLHDHMANLNVTNASNSAVFSVNQIGDIIASGAATINKLNFNFATPALALSENELIASGSAGVATVSANQTFVTIYNSIVTDKSLIYITPVGNMQYSPFLLKQVPKKSFTVGIDQSYVNPTIFNWLIIN